MAFGVFLFRMVSSLLFFLLLIILSNGEAFTFEPVKLESMPQHPLKEYCIVAVATVTQVRPISSLLTHIMPHLYQVVIISIAPKLEGLISVSVMVCIN